MNTYKRHRFPPDIISYAVWFYFRFNLSHRDIEDLLAQRGVIVSYESIRLWCIKFGQIYARRLKRRHTGYGDTFYIDEVFVKINGKHQYLWRAVDQDGEVVDVFLQSRRDGAAAKRFFKRLLRRQGEEPRQIVTDISCGESSTSDSVTGSVRPHNSQLFISPPVQSVAARRTLPRHKHIADIYSLHEHFLIGHFFNRFRSPADG